jgi:hypothetical protein
MSFRIPAPSLTNKLLPPCFRKNLSYDTVCRQQNIPLEVSFGVSIIFYKVKSWFLWKAWWVLVVYDSTFPSKTIMNIHEKMNSTLLTLYHLMYAFRDKDLTPSGMKSTNITHGSKKHKNKKQKWNAKRMCTILFLSYIPSARGIRPHTVPIEAAASLNSRRMRVWNHQTTRARSRRRQAIWTR